MSKIFKNKNKNFTCWYVFAMFWYWDSSKKRNTRLKNILNGRKEVWTIQLHFTNFINDEEMGIFSDLITECKSLALKQLIKWPSSQPDTCMYIRKKSKATYLQFRQYQWFKRCYIHLVFPNTRPLISFRTVHNTKQILSFEKKIWGIKLKIKRTWDWDWDWD